MAASIVTGLTASEEGDSVCPVCIDIYDGFSFFFDQEQVVLL